MICKLCLKNKPLCNSHIIPEFFYKMMYDEKGRMLKLSTVEGERNLYKQKGIYEKLLCKACEQLINKFEKHVKEVFYDNMEYYKTDNNNEIKIVNIDYNKFKLFQLSLLWRASISKDAFFENVNLGPHENKIRLMLLNEKPGDIHEYGCIIVGLSTQEFGSFDAIMKPEQGRIEGHRTYRFIMGSSLWLILVSQHSHIFERKRYFLQKDGTLLFKVFPAKEAPFISRMVENLRETGKLQ